MLNRCPYPRIVTGQSSFVFTAHCSLVQFGPKWLCPPWHKLCLQQLIEDDVIFRIETCGITQLLKQFQDALECVCCTELVKDLRHRIIVIGASDGRRIVKWQLIRRHAHHDLLLLHHFTYSTCFSTYIIQINTRKTHHHYHHHRHYCFYYYYYYHHYLSRNRKDYVLCKCHWKLIYIFGCTQWSTKFNIWSNQCHSCLQLSKGWKLLNSLN